VFIHLSVLVQEVGKLLSVSPGGRYLDGTLGGGGHAEQILLASGPHGEVLGLDRDEEALAAARQRLADFKDRLITRQASFAAARELLAAIHWSMVDGVILDLGISSHQIDTPERGFSFRVQAPLDMRMDRRQALHAGQIVNSFAAVELERIFRAYGEERQARRIAQAIVAERKARPIETTADLARLIERVKGGGWREHHPATQVFQALRIAVNDEIRQLEVFLHDGYELLRPGGRMAIIAFHSLEDRRVKQAFRKWSQSCICPPRAPICRCGWSQKARLLTRKPVVPSVDEIHANPRARSAKLRAVERV
jgi:16S rRNA (cytosine1402-N4)-methyltransferase